MVENVGGFSDDRRDRRARISAKPGAKGRIYGPRGPDNILNPLYRTGGLLFPYTPMINDTISVNYESYDPVHTNQPFAAFKSVAAKDITVIGTFTTMNRQEAETNLANIHFLRTITKMHFGVKDPLRGTPPPILMFNAYGQALYHNVPVIVTTYNVELPQDTDYVSVVTGVSGSPGTSEFRPVGPTQQDIIDENSNSTGGVQGEVDYQKIFIPGPNATAWLPTRFTISVTMQVQNTPDRLRREFNLNDFRTGALIKRGGWV